MIGARRDDDGRAGGGQPLRDGTAYAATAASYQRDATIDAYTIAQVAISPIIINERLLTK